MFFRKFGIYDADIGGGGICPRYSRGKYGVIVIIKFSSTRAGAICLCTDGSLFVNNWNASSSAITGWKEK